METTLNVEQLLEKKTKNQKEIWDLEKQINQLKKYNNSIEKELFKKCNHNWEIDWDDCCSKYKVCTICKLANMPNVYN